MAAVLFGGISNLCCTIVKCPFKVCGAGCDAVGGLCTNPFSSLIVVTLASQLPPIVKGFQQLVEVGGVLSCRGTQYMLGAIAFGVVHIAASFYLAIKIGNRKDPKMQHLHTASKRISHLLCKDPVMAIYILVWMGYFAYLIWGCTWNYADNEDDSCSDSISDSVSVAIGCGFFFIIGGLMASCFSVCCACCDRRDYSAPPPDLPQPGQPQPQQYTTPDVENPSSGVRPESTPTSTPTPAPPTIPASIYHTDTTQLPTPVAPPGEKTSKYSSDEQAPPTATFTSSGVPLVHAVPIPNTAPAHSAASMQSSKPPSAPPVEEIPNHHLSSSNINNSNTSDGANSGLGGMVGKNIRKLSNMDESKQHNLESRGERAGEATGKGSLNAKKFVNAQRE
eukprot:CAMPEP_0181110500 /NCGR_PEP_ID=MMETSP1071-20121207/18752_1 /TAXON_ID=35127 /ORGANISM="Thalassiosira sp., Strain NH16" /LENGTH=391 /DNA_ID=CAMNT_0023194285 /DNA_START=23 /DNA_END=1199 /DNA_ORIENTATION=-